MHLGIFHGVENYFPRLWGMNPIRHFMFDLCTFWLFFFLILPGFSCCAKVTEQDTSNFYVICWPFFLHLMRY